MRYLTALVGDIRYQVKYGFYFLYAFISAVYVIVLFLCPFEYRKAVASVIILTDPAMLGAFFIGGIWLLEKGEGLHSFWEVSPLKPMEYVLSKAVSLAIISTLAANVIAFAGLRAHVNYLTLSIGIFVGAMVFTLIGLLLASYALSVNHYMLIATLPLTVLLTPPIVAVFGISVPILDLTPGMALWHIIKHSIELSDVANIWSFIIMLVWLGIGVILASKRIPIAMQIKGGEKA